MDASQGQDSPESPGLLASVGALRRSLSGLLGSRVELAVLELGEVRDNALRLLVVGALAIVALCFGLACLTAMIVVLAWSAMGWTILLLLAALFGLVAWALAAHARTILARGGLSLSATMTELREDLDALR